MNIKNNYEDNFFQYFHSMEDMMDFIEKNPITEEEVDTTASRMELLASGGLLTEDNRKAAKIPAAISDEAIADTADNSAFAFVSDGQGYLLTETAVRQLANLSGIACPLFTKLPFAEKENLFASAFKYNPKKVKLVSLFEKVRGIVSERYKSIPAKDVFESSNKILDEIFEEENVSFVSGYFANEGTSYMARYKVVSDKLALYKARLENVGFDIGRYGDEDFYFEIVISTSESAESAVWASVYLCCGTTKFLLGNPSRICHVGSDADIANWETQLRLVASASDDYMQRFEALNNIPITYLTNAYSAIGKNIGLGKKDLAFAIDYLNAMSNGDDTGTALNIYATLGEVLNNLEKKNPAQILNMMENLSRLLNPAFPWESYDLPANI